jgi:uncharacterized membrane protein
MVKDMKGFIILLIVSLISGAQAATLHGTIYEWSDFDKSLKNAIVEVNSTPAQYMIATTGTYSFNLSPGGYLIKAKYFRNNILEYTTEEDIRIDHEGDFVHDLLLFPPTDTEYEYLGDINLTEEMNTRSETNYNTYIALFLIILLFISIILYWFKRNKSSTSNITVNEPSPAPIIAENKPIELPSDLHELYNLIQKMGGRVTQKELREKMAYSEAKVSLMLDDLENRCLIKKIKKGRSNIIIAEVQKTELPTQLYDGRKL